MWPVTKENNSLTSIKFQKWLKGYMNNWDKCYRNETHVASVGGFGLGSGIMMSIKEMLYAIEVGIVKLTNYKHLHIYYIIP